MLRREWVLTNGIGGYAMGTAAGVNTRRYHGLLISAIEPPTHRMVLVAGVDGFLETSSDSLPLSSNQYPGAMYPDGHESIKSFRAGRSVVWQFRRGGLSCTKQLTMHPGRNAVTLAYTNTSRKRARLRLMPLVCHKPHHENFYEQPSYPDHIRYLDGVTQLEHRGVLVNLRHPDAMVSPNATWYRNFEHVREHERGLPDRDDLLCPCTLEYDLAPGESAVLCFADHEAEPIPFPDEPVQDIKLSSILCSATEPFFVSTDARNSVLAGLPWFTDWGRDTMISLPGLCVPTGRVEFGHRLLLDYASCLDQGLIPNRFPEQGESPDTNTVDATLWFGNAAYKMLQAQWDEAVAQQLWHALSTVVEWHLRGTRHGIAVDADDSLLTQGEAGAQLTWMDAKIGDWVVTPRYGKPVEINALWINLLRVVDWLGSKLKHDTSDFVAAADRASESFERRFWCPERGYYKDTVDPDDRTLRPNQVIAMALPFSPVDPAHAEQALAVVARELLTPYGLRTLAPSNRDYVGKFEGDMAQRDAAYHRGTVWPWLLGSYCTAIVNYADGEKEAKRLLRFSRQMLTDYGLGGIAEVYDGDEPQSPGGCPWQAWSIAEILRAWTEDVRGD